MNKISDIAISVGSGITPTKGNPNFWNSKDVPWLKTEQLGNYKIYDTTEYISENALKETNIKIFPQNTISVAMYGEGKTRGNVSILAIPMTTNQACCNIVVDEEKANYVYVYYWLKNNYFQLRSLAAGVRKNLNSEDIKNFKIDVKDRYIQDRIAKLLSLLDEKIEKNIKINLELEKMAKTIYDYWFMQFDFPNENGKPYKSSGGRMVWNEELNREIPEGWKLEKLGDILEKKNDVIIPADAHKYPYTPMDLLPCNRMSFGDYKDGKEAKSSLLLYDEKAILFGSMRAYFHRVCIAPFIGVTRTTTFVLYPKHENILGYAYETLNLDSTVNYAVVNSIGTQQPYAVWEDSLEKMKLVKVPDRLKIKYSSMIKGIIATVIHNENEEKELASLRDFLLPLLMNGQVSFKEGDGYE